MPSAVPGGSTTRAGVDEDRWLLLIHQLPPKPDYFRVKIGRRLQRVGAVAIKPSVYALPHGDEAYEDLQWIVREILEGGGEASVCEASFLDGLTNDAVVALFRDARDRDYSAIVEAASRVAAEAEDAAPSRQSGGRGDLRTGELTRLRRRVAEVAAIDFFGAPGRTAAEGAVARAEAAVRGAARRAAPHREPSGSRTAEPATDLESLRGRVWVTRRDVHVDRIASAWLIRRFIDPAAQFKFVDAGDPPYRPAPGELRFDMFEAEYTHEGPHCTFETLLARFGLADAALAALGEIVHDIDVKESAFGRPETPGVAAMIAGIAATIPGDDDRLARGAELFDVLYAALGARPGRPADQ